MFETLLLLAQSGTDAVVKSADGYSAGEIAGLVSALVTLLGAIGGGFRWLWGAMMDRLDVIRQDFKEQLEATRNDFNAQLQAKDTEINRLSKALSKKSDEQAATIERLQDRTIEKVEKMADQYVDLATETNGILQAFQVKLRGDGPGV